LVILRGIILRNLAAQHADAELHRLHDVPLAAAGFAIAYFCRFRIGTSV
jgi:hypothetical protein